MRYVAALLLVLLLSGCIIETPPYHHRWHEYRW